MKKSVERAIANLANHGDTDIFPFPFENMVIFDQAKEVTALLLDATKDFDSYITRFPPSNYGALAPVGYTGFRWATQIDPLWNIYFLSLVIRLGDRIEAARLPTDKSIVFSYRFNSEEGSSDLFRREFGWRKFNEIAIEKANKYKYVVSCDISEFYPRINHHRLDNALRQLPKADKERSEIMDFLSNFSETYSFGLPVGGPASRLLSELTLNQIDRLLYQKRIEFCRFADDYYLFTNSQPDSFKALVYLSMILQRNQGLQLQKSKTRIMSSAEFLATNPLTMEIEETGPDKELAKVRRELFTFSLHFDPYSPTASDDYESLRTELSKFPVLDLIKSELLKSKVNISLTRKLTSTLKFISDSEVGEACQTLIENEELLYPVYFNVLSAVRSEVGRIPNQVKTKISNYIIELIDSRSAIMSVDLNLQYAIRLLSMFPSEEATSTLGNVYESTTSQAIRRDIILIMAKWRNWIWLSDRKAEFRSMGQAERRAFIVASYSLKDEGSHWRSHMATEFTPFEVIVRNWAKDRVNTPTWEYPL